MSISSMIMLDIHHELTYQQADMFLQATLIPKPLITTVQ